MMRFSLQLPVNTADVTDVEESVLTTLAAVLVACACLAGWLTTPRQLAAAREKLLSTQTLLRTADFARAQDERSLHDWLELYEWAEEAASLGLWQWDPKDGMFSLSRGAAAIAAFPGGPCRVTRAELGAAIHPDDLEGIERAQKLAFAQEGKTTYDVEYRRIRPDGSIRWYHNRSSTEFKNGTPTRVVGTVLDITNHRELLLHLETVKQGLEDALRAKSQFLANVSHEIRTPMNAVMGMTNLLLDLDLTDEAKDYVNIIRTSSDALLSVINDILDFSKIESDKLDPEYIPISLHECLEEAAELLAPQCAEKGLEIAVDVDLSLSDWVYGNCTRLRQIVVNLAGNAVKFTERGEVIIRARKIVEPDGDTCIKIAVSDTGIGIDASKLDRLFQSFSQVDASTTRKFGGTGLGLAISKRLAELLGGRMWVESQPGVGSTFQFSLPYRPAPSQESPPAPGDDWAGKRILVVDDNPTSRFILTAYLARWNLASKAVASSAEALVELRAESYHLLLLDWHMPEMDGPALARAVKSEFGSAAPPMVMMGSSAASAREAFHDQENPFAATMTKPMRRQHLHRLLLRMLTGFSERRSNARAPDSDMARRTPLRILLADDNQINQKVASRLLGRWGYRLDVVSNGLEVLEALRRQPYDLVFLDVQMPEMDGLEAARRICIEWGRDKRPFLTALTAGAMKEDRDQCLAAGMDGYLSKPLNVRELRTTLENCYTVLSGRTPPLATDQRLNELTLTQ